VAAGLLHVPAQALPRAPDGLAVGDLGRCGRDLDPELALHSLHHHLEVGLAHPVSHGLVRLVRAFDAERGVLLAKARERGGQLVLISLGLRGDGVGQQWLGHLRRRDLHRVVLGGKHVAGRRVRQFGDGTDVAGGHLRHGVVLLASEAEQLAHPLVRALRGVVDSRVGPHRAREHAEHRDVADVRVGDRLEHQRGEWL
jgi:hypothetical protein